ncbi:MAG: MBOAT family protein [Bacteroidales bacterium]|nr:MBOAT family protein [Candidatus Sodaliphilus fimicaballi]
MEFNSWSFVLFFPIVCLIYWGIKAQRARNIFLLIASYYFYMNWDARYGLLLLGNTLISYLASIGLEHVQDHSRRKWLVSGSVFLNLSLIAFFKYANFGVETVNWVMATLGIGINIPLPNILLPVGVSFYVFQSVGYIVDVYRRDIKAEKDFINYALFVSFFPQLVAGPIERSSNMLPQFRRQHKFDDDAAISGFKLMLWGYFMKLALADRCAVYVQSVFDTPSADGYSSIIGTILFPFQIYGDFAGYSFIAIGAARIMGFHLKDNFNHPLFAVTVSDFWRRWHISLSTWFRDYVYFPLGGSRCKKWRIYFNLFVTFLASGLWHGATWTYVAWGGAHGIALGIERALGWHKKQFKAVEKWMHIAFTFVFVAMARLIYRAGTLGLVHAHLVRMADPANFTIANKITQMAMIFIAIIIVIAKDAVEEWWPKDKLAGSTPRPIWKDVAIITGMLLLLSIMASPEGGTFVYFQF